jgi:hypothetical protein
MTFSLRPWLFNRNARDVALLGDSDGSLDGFLHGHKPLWFERTLYRGDAYEFHNQMSGIQGSMQPAGRFLSKS